MTVPDHDPAALDALAALGGPAMVTQVLRNLTELVDRLPGDLRASASTGAHDQLRRQAHSILSISGYAGETALRAAGHAIEQAVRAGDHAALDALLQRFEQAAAAVRPRLAAALARWSTRT